VLYARLKLNRRQLNGNYGSLLSFGYTLVTGVIMNFIAGVTASRLMIQSLSTFAALRKPQYFGARRIAQS
jgi:hypothetical protein